MSINTKLFPYLAPITIAVNDVMETGHGWIQGLDVFVLR